MMSIIRACGIPIPIVYNVGGLGETIHEYNSEDKSGNGLVFEKYTVKDLVRAVKRALKIYKKKEQWHELQLSVMQQDFSWNNSTEKYLEIYTNLMNT